MSDDEVNKTIMELIDILDTTIESLKKRDDLIMRLIIYTRMPAPTADSEESISNKIKDIKSKIKEASKKLFQNQVKLHNVKRVLNEK